MKSTKCDKGNTSELQFPKLMINSAGGDVVFMTSSRTGTVVYSGNFELGYTSSGWNTRYFKDYSGTITLENSNDH
jgi:hypothetical protein